jgi:eukaryotic-like serine/threonine-protein kinase
MSINSGSLLNNRYLIENIIAQGGMGAVYRALDQALNIQVALKENLLFTEDSTRQFHQEATMLAGLRHPNLPRVTDHFILPDQGEYLVMDFIEGQDIRQYINRDAPLALNEAIQIGVTICDALFYLHSRKPPIIHRDIKPSNIKITPQGHIYLVDFGLAKIEIEGQATATGARSLTPGYAPPEQYGKGTDARSDVYALGATLYAILTKNIPEDGIARLIGATSLTPLQKARPDIPLDICQAIEKAIAIKREDRFQTAEEFKAALLGTPSPQKTVQPSQPPPSSGGETPIEGVTPPSISSPPDQNGSYSDNTVVLASSKPPISAKPKKIPLPILIVSGLVLAVIAGALLLLTQLSSNPASTPTAGTDQTQDQTGVPQTASGSTFSAKTQPANPRPSPAAPTSIPVAVIPTPQLVITPNGGGNGQIAFTSEKSGKPQIWMINSDGSSQQQVSNLPDGACQPDWSPDGKKLIIVSPCSGQKESYPGSGLFTINPDGSGLMPLPSLPGGDYDPAWSPDGTRIAFTSIRNGAANIYVLNLTDKSVQRISKNNITEQRPVWSPDGKWLAIESARQNQRQIWIVAPKASSSANEFSNVASAAFMPDWSPDGQVILFSQGSSLPWLVAKQYNVAAAPESRISNVRPALQAKYSPDGFWVVFTGRENETPDIYLMTVTGTNLTRLTRNNAPNYDPVWRPLVKK